MPAMMGMLPGIELSAKTALIPILNPSLVCKEMLSGIWHWNYIALIFGSSCLYAGIALSLAVKMFNRERQPKESFQAVQRVFGAAQTRTVPYFCKTRPVDGKPGVNAGCPSRHGAISLLW